MTLTKRQKIIILDDHPVYLNLIAQHLAQTEHFLIKKFTKVDEFLNGLINKKPEIIVMDYHMDGDNGKEVNGLEVIKKIRDANPESYVIVLTRDDKIETAVNCIKAGAYDYVVKNESAFVRVQNMLHNINHILYAKKEASINKQAMRFLTWLLGIAISGSLALWWFLYH